MDSVDITQRDYDTYEKSALSHRKPVDAISPNGECHNCGESVELPKLFCDGICAKRYEHEKKIKNGGRT